MTDLFEVQLLIDELTVPQRDALLNRIINEFRILYTGEGYYTYKYINQLDKYQLSLVEKWLKPVIAEKKKEERLHSLKNLKQEIERQQLLKQELEKTLIEIQSVKQLIKKEQKPSIIKDLNEE